MLKQSPLAELLPAIAGLPLALAEKCALHLIHQHPDISDEQLADLLDMRKRGVQDLLRRMRGRGYIQSRGKGRARTIHSTYHVEHHVGRGD